MLTMFSETNLKRKYIPKPIVHVDTDKSAGGEK